MYDIKELNIPNVCFSIVDLLDKDDKRQEEYKQQRIERGFDDTETWNLDYTIGCFIVPRLKRFKEITNGYPPELTFEEWQDILDKMINAFELKVEETEEILTLEQEKTKTQEIQEGLDLFAKYCSHLWW